MSVDDIFRRQYGMISREQARAGGMTPRQIDHRLSSGQWQPEHRGVYRLGAVRPTWRGEMLAATLATKGVASHRAAVALWGLEHYYATAPEVTTPSGRTSLTGGVVRHRSKQWDRRDETIRHGIVCTGVERTILDVAGVTSLVLLERIAESAIRQRLTTWVLLLECLRRHSRQGRNGCLNLRRLLEQRLINRVIPLSTFSRLVTNVLIDAGLPSPVLEFKIFDDDGDFVMQTDLAWPNLRKAWELDGLQFHFGRLEVERDRRKRNRAKSCGWNIQEILWSMYVDDPSGLAVMARKFLAS